MERWTGISSKSGCLFLENGRWFFFHPALPWKQHTFSCLKRPCRLEICRFHTYRISSSCGKHKMETFIGTSVLCVLVAEKGHSGSSIIETMWASLQGFHSAESHQSSSDCSTDNKRINPVSNCCFPWYTLTADVCRGCVFCCCGLVSSGWLGDAYVTHHPWELHSIFYMSLFFNHSSQKCSEYRGLCCHQNPQALLNVWPPTVNNTETACKDAAWRVGPYDSPAGSSTTTTSTPHLLSG